MPYLLGEKNLLERASEVLFLVLYSLGMRKLLNNLWNNIHQEVEELNRKYDESLCKQNFGNFELSTVMNPHRNQSLTKIGYCFKSPNKPSKIYLIEILFFSNPLIFY